MSEKKVLADSGNVGAGGYWVEVLEGQESGKVLVRATISGDKKHWPAIGLSLGINTGGGRDLDNAEGQARASNNIEECLKKRYTGIKTTRERESGNTVLEWEMPNIDPSASVNEMAGEILSRMSLAVHDRSFGGRY
jgi:hypothetical protein